MAVSRTEEEMGDTMTSVTNDTGSWTLRHICKMFTPSRSRTLQTVLLFHALSFLLNPCLAYPQFREENTAFSLQTIAVDAQRDTVFVGSVNRVYKLNSNLSLEQETVTGPVQDNTDCIPRSMNCGTAVSTDNFNKVLLVDDDRLIVCGTVYQGVCDILSVDTLGVLSNSSMTEVAVNTDYGTTVAFVGNGPGDTKTLYVGSSTSLWLRENLWTLSSRQLPSDLSSSSLFQVYNGMDPRATNPTLIQIPTGTIDDSPSSQKFNISYVSGFAANGFSYFVAIQPKNHLNPSNYYTKLSRVCQQDDHFYSYIELPLRCYGYGDGERTLYNLAQSAYIGTVGTDLGSAELQPGSEVLYVVFAESEGLMTAIPSARSAVCMYPLSAIDEAFWNRRLGCARQETDRTDIDWLGSRDCGTSMSMINEINSAGPSYCHMNENNVPLGGEFPIEARAIYTHSSVLTSIAATVHREQTVIFLGDEVGQLKKLWVVDSDTATLYEELMIDADGGMVKNGMVLTPDENHVYVMTETKVTKVPVEECELYTTFKECVGRDGVLDDVGDPYCGWCSLIQRCTRGVEFECPGVDNPSLPRRWLTRNEENTRIEKITPPNTDSGTTIMLHITVVNLPALDDLEAYQCIFGDLGDRPAAVNTTVPDRTVVMCYTPLNIPEPVDGFTQVDLALRHTKTNVDVVSTDFYFYKCSTFSTCSECVAQEFGCNWCGYENFCTVNQGQCEQSGVILGSGTPTLSPTDVIGQEYCPRVDIGNDTEILIPAGIQRDIRLSVANLLAPLDGQTSGYECVFEYESMEVSVQAYLDGDDTLVCQQRVYDYETDISSVTGTMLVTWNDVYLITEKQIPVVLYKCEVDRSNCGLCLSADPKFQCGWCSSMFECGMEAQCLDNKWLIGENAVCPNPTIREISPMSGYFAGGTYLTIKGYNLGLTAADIVSIRVAGIECIKDEGSYTTALQISCTTASSLRPDSGYVEVTIGNSGGQMYVATSENRFSYVLPKITGVSPAYGPSSGGSLVSILGHNLDAGSSSIANLNAIPCQIVSAFPTEVLCLSGRAGVGTMGYVSMTVDNHYVEGSSVFEYRSDPVITRVGRFSSISSGSLELNVEGTDFDTIQWPQLSFMIEDQQLISNCSKISSTSMVCMTPSVRDLNLTVPIDIPIANVSFFLDGVMEYTPLQNNGQISGLDETFTFVPDPVFYPFENEKIDLEFDQRKFIKISGDNLTLAYREGDVRVTIGGEPCTDVVVKQQELTCYAPDEAPLSQEEGRNTFDVRVYHGALSFYVGQVEYLPQAIPLALIVGSVAGGVLFFLLILIMGVCIASCRKNNNNEKIFKQMEEQIGTLELTVAQECKEAFAELQTGVLSITHDIKGHGIPILDYRTYVVKSLFPENPNHAVLKELSVAGVRKDFVQKGLWQFGQLLSNKSFLLIFIRVLEEQRTLSTKDLSNVASLLVVAFQGKMEYCTDILKALMARAIKQHVKEGEESTRVFMRRGVSVVEKMVGQWLAVLLYNHLQDSAGEPLFKLFYAIKQQVEKGPVDQVTGEARYSLTEGKLIRQQVEVKQLTLKAQGPDRNTPMVEVKVLDCDTVSQTKAKILDAIYKTAPYSQRPKKEELDLEWYDRPAGKLLLFDDDALRPVEGGWRRINTLSHYQVTEGATFYLLQAQGSSGSLHSNHSSPARSYNNVNVSYNIQTPASSMSPMITLDFENANRMWHLVKPDDHQHLENGVTDRKMMAEIYLPRLLTTKTILHKFVDDLVMTIFMLNDESSLPLAIKYLFDFLDEQAQENGITDPAIIHAWKSNSLPLRFWVNLIKNPDMIFDIHKADTVDSCLSVVAQCVMEACSVSEQQLNKNSPASKLLYAKDIPTYKDYVGQYYKDVQNMPVISDQDMNAMLAEHSQRHHYDFSMLSALNELYFGYACKYRSELITALDEDNTAIKQGHAEKIEEIERIMSKSF